MKKINFPSDQNKTPSPQNQRASFWLWGVFFLMLILSNWGVMRGQQAFFYQDLLTQLPVGMGYVAISGIFFGLAGILSAIAILLRWPFTPLLVRLVVMLYAGWHWFDKILVARSETALTNWPFELGMTVIGIVFIVGLFARRREKMYFQSKQNRVLIHRKDHDESQSNRN